jgi:hypothetical protein
MPFQLIKLVHAGSGIVRAFQGKGVGNDWLSTNGPWPEPAASYPQFCVSFSLFTCEGKSVGKEFGSLLPASRPTLCVVPIFLP